MSMDVGSKSGGPKSDINITPLVDIVLVLLIIFMVLTPSMLKHLTTTVPKKSDDKEQQSAGQSDYAVLVEYSADRQITVNTEPISTSALGANIKERLKGARQKTVFFKASDEAPYGEVVRLMDIARGVGAQNLAVIIQ